MHRDIEDARGVVGALAGLGLVILGINTSLWVGVVGFGLIVAAVALALTPSRSGGGTLGVVDDDGAAVRGFGVEVADGQPVRLAPGTTWVELVPDATGSVTVG